MMTVAELNKLRERIQHALEAVDYAIGQIVAGRAEWTPDAYAAVGDEVSPGATLTEALELPAHLDPVEVQGWAVVRRLWAVRVPTVDGDGEVDGDEVMEFATKAEAEAFIAAANAP